MTITLLSAEKSTAQLTSISWMKTDSKAESRDESDRGHNQFEVLSKVLLPEYHLIRQISCGGLSNVYEAVETRLGRRVAIKVLASYRSVDDSAIRQFHREARIVARLAHHPRIVRIYNIEEKAGFHFFTMNLATGGSLREHLSRVKRMEAVDVVRIILQLLEALQFIHENGVVHGDIKPENLVLDDEEQVILTDFGISRQAIDAKDEDHGRTSGTPAYISPEQASGRAAVPENDLYSVGVMMYEMLSGKLPFQAEDPAVMLMKHACEQPTPLSWILPQIDSELVGVVDQLMQKRPEMRPASAVAAAYQLRQTKSFREAQASQLRPACSVTEQKQNLEPVFKGGEDADRNPNQLETRLRVNSVFCLPIGNQLLERVWPRAKWAALLAGSVLAGVLIVELQWIQGQPATKPILNYSPAPVESTATPNNQAVPQVSQETLPPPPSIPEIVKKKKESLPPHAKAVVLNPRPVSRSSLADSGHPMSNHIEEPQQVLEGSPGEARSLAGGNDSGESNPTPAVSMVHSYAVRHDHISGGCQGQLVLHADYLEFISEKDKDSRRWNIGQIHDVKLKGASELHFDSTEKDLKKLGFAKRSYRFIFLDQPTPPELVKALHNPLL